MIFQKKTLWMAIINLTPDSFSDGGLYKSPEQVLEKCNHFVSQGADILDFGGVSTNPKVEHLNVSPEEELQRIYKTIKLVRSHIPKNILISIDTFSPTVAYTLAKEGLVDIINDICAAQKYENVDVNKDDRPIPMTTAHVASLFNLGLVLMHMGSFTEVEQLDTNAENKFLQNILKFLKSRLEFCQKLGVSQIAIDPGIGYGRFGKTLPQILNLLKQESIESLKSLSVPILYGLSRKSFLSELDSSLLNPVSRDQLSKEIELNCIKYGANIIRTHNLSGII
jgi:dihydropteroate synthase